MQVCVLLPTYNDNVTLLAFDISYRRAHSSKPAAAACGGRMGQTDKRTDGRTDARQLHRLCSTYYAGSVNNGPLYPASLPSKPLLAISAGHCARLYLLTC